MKRYLLSMIAICLYCFNQNLQAQCTPDTTLKTSTVLPLTLAPANVGTPYQQEIKYYITADTSVYVEQLGTTVDAHIDTLWIIDVAGLPVGFNYACHNPDCKIEGGNAGCALITGTANASQTGTYPLTVYTKIRATAMLGPLPVSQTIFDSISRYSLVISGASGTAEILQNNQLKLYPNPAKDFIQFAIPEIAGKISYRIVSGSGEIVKEGSSADITLQPQINLQGLSDGIYFIEVRQGERRYNSRFILNRSF